MVDQPGTPSPRSAHPAIGFRRLHMVLWLLRADRGDAASGAPVPPGQRFCDESVGHGRGPDCEAQEDASEPLDARRGCSRAARLETAVELAPASRGPHGPARLTGAAACSKLEVDGVDALCLAGADQRRVQGA